MKACIRHKLPESTENYYSLCSNLDLGPIKTRVRVFSCAEIVSPGAEKLPRYY
jgi:hypothetical protein